MLNSLDIALLCDSRTVDGAGLAITPDRSRHGIHAQLGDGATAGTMPTLDALNGRFTFDGGDDMRIAPARDVAGVLAGMGGPHPETYIFYLDPLIMSGAQATILSKFSNPAWVLIRWEGASSRILFLNRQVGGTDELYYLAAPDTAALQNRRLILAYVRDTNSQRGYADAVQIFADTDVTVDGSGVSTLYLGASDIGQYLPNGNGLRAFFYDGSNAWTPTQLRALQRFLRGNL